MSTPTHEHEYPYPRTRVRITTYMNREDRHNEQTYPCYVGHICPRLRTKLGKSFGELPQRLKAGTITLLLP